MVDTPCIFVGGMESGLTADASCLGQEWIKRVAEAMPEGEDVMGGPLIEDGEQPGGTMLQ